MRTLTYTIHLHNATKATSTKFRKLFDDKATTPMCILFLDGSFDDDANDDVLIDMIYASFTTPDENFSSVFLGLSGESQPAQLLDSAGVIMVATIIEGTAGLVVDDTFYVECPIRSRWHYGDYIYMVLCDTCSVVPEDNRDNAYLPDSMVRYEIMYINKRDLPVLKQTLRDTNSRHIHYYVYVGIFRQTRSDPFYACCDIAQTPVIGNEIRRLHTPHTLEVIEQLDEVEDCTSIPVLEPLPSPPSPSPPPPPVQRLPTSHEVYYGTFDDLAPSLGSSPMSTAPQSPWAYDD